MDTTTQILFEQGKDAFLQGEYRLSIEYLEQVTANLSKATREGSEVRLWLVSAYQANNRSEDAISLCRELTTSPFPSTKERAKQQLYILEAPKLERPKEWVTQIPSMEDVLPIQSVYVASKKEPKKKELTVDDFEDLSQIETGDNQFLLIALGLGVVALIGWGVWGA